MSNELRLTIDADGGVRLYLPDNFDYTDDDLAARVGELVLKAHAVLDAVEAVTR